MIIKTYPNKNIYGKFFLVTEAPNDEEVTEEIPKPRRNVKVISVKPSNRGKDFTQVGNPPITPDESEVNDDLDIDDTDYNNTEESPPLDNNENTTTETEPTNDSVQEDQNTTTQVEANPENDDIQDNDNQPDTGENDTTDFSNNEDDGQNIDINDTGEDGPDVGGDDDFAASTDVSTSADDTQPSEDNGTTNNESKPTPPGVELDSTRKYNLYKEFMSLYNASDNYISKLENVLKNDFEENQIIRIAVNNLREIKDILFDYMTIRFQLNTYVQSLLFYQKMVVAVQLVFNLLKSIKSNSSK